MRRLFTFSIMLLLAVPVAAQDFRVIEDDEWCEDSYRNNDDREHYCEVREITLAAGRNVVEVDGGMNGGISVEGWDRNEILVRAKVTGTARTEAVARELADRVSIDTDGVIVADIPRATGGRSDNRSWAAVSFEVFVPVQSNLSLETHNGGIKIASIDGDVRFRVLNGGVELANLSGEVEGRTTNGGLKVELSGDSWDGEGMNVTTTNGGVSLYIPEDYSAQLETGTVNGQIDFDFPITVKGRLDKKISTTLGEGGKMIRVTTTNGGVRVRRS